MRGFSPIPRNGNKKDFEKIILEVSGKSYIDRDLVKIFAGSQSFSGLDSKYLRLEVNFKLSTDNTPVQIEDFYQFCCNSTSITKIDFRGAAPSGIITDVREMFRGCTNLATIIWGEACTIPECVQRDNMFLGCNLLEEQDGF